MDSHMEEVLTVQSSPLASPAPVTLLPLCVRWQDLPKMHRHCLAEYSQPVHNLYHHWPCRVVVVVSQLRCLTDLTGKKNIVLTSKAMLTSCWVILAPPAKCQLLKPHFCLCAILSCCCFNRKANFHRLFGAALGGHAVLYVLKLCIAERSARSQNTNCPAC